MYTITEENYLKAVFKLSEEDQSVGTNELSQALGTSPASVTDMMKKLSDKKLVHHQPYKGVRLSASGRKLALEIVRKHRLWEVFLVEKLQFNWDQIHDIAEQLEHIQAPELILKLDAYLGFPRFDPHGDPIPDASGKFETRKTILMQNCIPGDMLSIAGVTLHSADFLQYLDKQKLNIGRKLKVVEVLPFDHSLVLELGAVRITVSAKVSAHILVIKNR